MQNFPAKSSDFWARLRLSEEISHSLESLSQSRILLIGAGGLGNDIALRLAGCYISSLTLVDGDVISEANIPHSTLFLPKHVGLHKVDVVRDFLVEKFPNLVVHAEPKFIQQCDIDLFDQHDFIICAPDNEQTRRWANFYAVKFRKPALFIGVSGAKQAEWTGYTLLYKPNQGPCFVCLATGGEDTKQPYESIPTSEDIENDRHKCGGANIPVPMLAPVVGTLSGYSATIVLKYLSQSGDIPTYSHIDLKRVKVALYEIKAVPTCSVCGHIEEYDLDPKILEKLKPPD